MNEEKRKLTEEEKEELKEDLKKQIDELSDEELNQVAGGGFWNSIIGWKRKIGTDADNDE